MNASEKRLARFKSLLIDVHKKLGLEFGFRLWDGSRVPADWPRGALMIAIADEGVVASLVRAPKLTTLANLWAAKRLDIVNGGIFDLVAARPKGRTRELRRNIDKFAALTHRLRLSVHAARRPMAAGIDRQGLRKRRQRGRKQEEHRLSL